MSQPQQQPLVNPFRKPGGTRPVYAKVGIFAESGGGKTHFALNAPKPAVVDPESGTEWFRGRPGFGDWEVMQNLFGDVVDQVHYALTFLEHGFEKETVYDPVLKHTVERLTHRRRLFQDEASGVMYPVHDRETFVMDPITLVWDQIQFEQATKIARSREDFVHKDWGEMKRDYKSLLNRFIQLPMHVIVLARHAFEKDQKTGDITGEKMDAEKSTIYSFDLAFQLVEKGGRRDAIIYKDRSNTHQKGQRVEDVSWDSLVVPILQRLQALAPHHDALRDMFRAWRAAGVSDMAAKVIIEQQTGKCKSEDLQLPEVQQLTQYFLELRDKRAQKGGGSGAGGGTGGDNPQDPAHTGGEGAAGPGPGPGAG